MTNVGKTFTRFTNILKMGNACASSFGRYRKSLNEWYTMYVKNFNFLFKSMFLRKNDRIEKNWNSFATAPQKNNPPLLNRLPPEFRQLFSPHLLVLKRGSYRKWNIVLHPEFFCTYWYIFLLLYTRVMEVKDTHYVWGSC